MIKKIFILIAIILIPCAYCATYKVKTSGQVYSKEGKLRSSPQSYYNNYASSSYIKSGSVNKAGVQIIDIVMDFSGSMSPYVDEARNSMSKIVMQIPSDVAIGFRVFGQGGFLRSSESITASFKGIKKSNGSSYKVQTKTVEKPKGGGLFCSATKQVASVSKANANSLIKSMNNVSIGSATPLTYALEMSVAYDFANFDKTTPKKIVLITDGGESCSKDPCAFARNLMSKRNDIHIDVVMIGNSRALVCLTNETGGSYMTVNDISNFNNVLIKSITNTSFSNTQTQTPKVDSVQQYEFTDD